MTAGNKNKLKQLNPYTREDEASGW